ncbi:two-component system sensor histidine kinase KdbD, partial [Pseudomonas sp. MWU12-2115]
LLAYARTRNVSKLVVGKSVRNPLVRLWQGSLVNELTRLSGDVDIYVVAHELEDESSRRGKRVRSLLFSEDDEGKARRGYLAASAICFATTAVNHLLVPYFALSNVIMVHLLAVVLIATRYGRGPGVLASFLSVAAFDFFFVPPRLSFAV